MNVKLNDLINIYENEVKKNVKNKQKIFNFEKHKMEYLCDIKRVLDNDLYDGGKYNIFLIYEPKIRVIMSQGIYDKIINHYVTRFILEPKLSKYLGINNCATRKNMGTKYALQLFKKEIEKFKKYDTFYFLKLDISKYFYRINHDVLKLLLLNDLNEKEYNLVSKIIDSTNKDYVNKKISYLENKLNEKLSKYEFGCGLPIGNLTSQFLAIFYLNRLQHYITHNLHVKFINYMDDYIFIHESKNYLNKFLKEIEKILNEKYKLKINEKKTFISSSKGGITFLGYLFKVKNKKTIIKITNFGKRNIRKGIKRTKYLYNNGYINFSSYFSSIMSIKHSHNLLSEYKINEIINNG